MTVSEMIKRFGLKIFTAENYREIKSVYCSDMLSVALARVKQDSVFVTVVNNANAAAVAYGNGAACIVLTENVRPDITMWNNAAMHEICILGTHMDTYHFAVELSKVL